MIEKSKKNTHQDLHHKVAERALVVGDPDKAAEAAELLENAEEIWNMRSYRAFTGSYEGKKITVCSHGVGAAGALAIFDKLFKAGVRTVIRAGTCGTFQEKVKAGDILIGTGSIREDRVTEEILPIEYPAIADHQVTGALEEAAAEHGYNPHVGIIRSNDLFLSYVESQKQDRLEKWRRVGVIGDDGEFSALLVLASIYEVRAGGVFVTDGNASVDMDSWLNTPTLDAVAQGKKMILEIGISALARL